MSNPNPQPAPPLDLAQFAGNLEYCKCAAREYRDPVCTLCNLRANAPALLAECQRQRHLLDAFATGVQDMLDAWDKPTSASVKMRASAIAGLRGIMEHHQPTKEIK